MQNEEVKIADFAASPSKVTYIIAADEKGYFVQSKDSNMKDSEGNSKGRNVIVGRLTDGEWKAGKSGVPVYENFSLIGLPFKGLVYSESNELFGVKGDLRRNQKGYHIVGEAPTDITSSEMSELLAEPFLQHLEHFMVPEVMASKIRDKSAVVPVTHKQLSNQGVINYGKIKIENLMKRPDRMIYMLVDTTGQIKSWQQIPKFVIINNDSDMVESYQLYHENWKTEIHSPQTRRHITVARLIDKKDEQKLKLCEGLKGSESTLFKGFAYPTSLYGDDGGDLISKKIKKEIGKKEFSKRFPDLYAGAGRIESSYCYKSESEKNITYTTINEMPIEEKTSEMAKLLTPSLLRQLERFTVPHEMAAQIREHAKS